MVTSITSSLETIGFLVTVFYCHWFGSMYVHVMIELLNNHRTVQGKGNFRYYSQIVPAQAAHVLCAYIGEFGHVMYWHSKWSDIIMMLMKIYIFCILDCPK